MLTAPLRVLVALCVFASARSAAAQDYSLSGPHGAGWTTVTVTRPSGSTFSAQLHYPAQSSGQGAAYDPSGAPYPALSFGHGFLQAPSAYQNTLQHLASWGYFVIASQSELSLFPSHQALANDMRHCLDWLEQQEAAPSSQYFQQVDTLAFGMSGHSMGAGCSILASAADARVVALANLAAANTNPSAIAAIPLVRCPLSLISGSQDGTTPLASNGQLMFNAALSPKLLPVITGGWHCGFVDVPALGGFGCDSGSLSKSAQLALTRRLLAEFFELHLRGNDALWPRVWGAQMQFDPALSASVEPFARVLPFSQRLPGVAGGVVVFAVEVRNTGATPDEFELLVDGLSWPHAFSAASTGSLAPGASANLQLTVNVPAGQPAGLERFTLSARRLSDGGSRAFGLRGVRTF